MTLVLSDYYSSHDYEWKFRTKGVETHLRFKKQHFTIIAQRTFPTAGSILAIPVQREPNIVPLVGQVLNLAGYTYTTSTHKPMNIQPRRIVESMLVLCWLSVIDAGPTWNQHWLNVAHLLRSTNICGGGSFPVLACLNWPVSNTRSIHCLPKFALILDYDYSGILFISSLLFQANYWKIRGVTSIT